MPLPVYPFTGESYWLDSPVKQSIAGPTDQGLETRVLWYFRKLFARHLELDPAQIEPGRPLAEYGFDSLIIKKLNQELETELGGVSKTLFFECPHLEAVVRYCLKHHRQSLLPKLEGADIKNTLPVLKHKDPGSRTILYRPSAKIVPELHGTAIIGMSGRYPRANNLQEFWNRLQRGEDCITEIPAERWNYQQWYDAEGRAGKTYTKWGGFITGVDQFDPLFFKISPLEARSMDPQERLFLQTAWQTLEDAGYTCATLGQAPVNSKVGVFVGAMWSEYQLYGMEKTNTGGVAIAGSPFWSIPNRVSYCFNFFGPSMAVDTACSSSLTAIHLACESIRRGECSLALAGGVSLSLHPNKYVFLSNSGYASHDGKCRSFGEGGDGYVPGEGVGAIFFKAFGAGDNRRRPHLRRDQKQQCESRRPE